LRGWGHDRGHCYVYAYVLKLGDNGEAAEVWNVDASAWDSLATFIAAKADISDYVIELEPLGDTKGTATFEGDYDEAATLEWGYNVPRWFGSMPQGMGSGEFRVVFCELMSPDHSVEWPGFNPREFIDLTWPE
jgi:hypothetical protein